MSRDSSRRACGYPPTSRHRVVIAVASLETISDTCEYLCHTPTAVSAAIKLHMSIADWTTAAAKYASSYPRRIRGRTCRRTIQSPTITRPINQMLRTSARSQEGIKKRKWMICNFSYPPGPIRRNVCLTPLSEERANMTTCPFRDIMSAGTPEGQQQVVVGTV